MTTNIIKEARMRYTPLFLLASILVGCASDTATKQNLNTGYEALDKRQYDEAINAADAQLQKAPTGPGSAEALYLKGRALEQKQSHSTTEARQNFLQARDAYNEALRQQPAPQLEARIRAGIANTSYWLDDYATAIKEWNTAYGS